jgi:hypothetical protein
MAEPISWSLPTTQESLIPRGAGVTKEFLFWRDHQAIPLSTLLTVYLKPTRPYVESRPKYSEQGIAWSSHDMTKI